MCGSPRPLRVLLADDHAMVREGLRALLERAGFDIVGEAANGHEAVRLCETLRPHVALLDIGMPLLNGVDAAREVAKHGSDTKVILVSMHAEECYVVAGLRAGASGFVLKSSGAPRLVDAIEAVARNETYLSPGVSKTLVDVFLSGAAAPKEPLSARERQVLQLLAEGKNVKEIGSMLGISARTAETHRARIMERLNIHEVAGLVRYAIAHGLTSLS